MDLSEIKFEKGKCYKAVDSRDNSIKLFKFEVFDRKDSFVTIDKGIRISPTSINIEWVCMYIGHEHDIEEIDESVIDKLVKQFNLSMASILATVNRK